MISDILQCDRLLFIYIFLVSFILIFIYLLGSWKATKAMFLNLTIIKIKQTKTQS